MCIRTIKVREVILMVSMPPIIGNPRQVSHMLTDLKPTHWTNSILVLMNHACPILIGSFIRIRMLISTTACCIFFSSLQQLKGFCFLLHGWIENSKYPRKIHRVSGPRPVCVWRDWPKVSDDAIPPRRPLNPIYQNLFIYIIKIRLILTIFKN